MICNSPLDPEIWIRLDDLDNGIARYYWEHINALALLGRSDERDERIDYFLSQLLKYDRPYSAAQVITFSQYSNSEIIMCTLFKCCEMQNCMEPTGASLRGLSEHDVLTLFDRLYSNQNIELDELVQLEISFLPYFRFHSTPKGIAKFLLENPVEYVKLITMNYKPDSGVDPVSTDFSDEQCRIAYEIVDLFKTIPGCDGTTISEMEFSEWVAAAQKYAEQIGYKNSFVHCFGRVLSYAPVGSDGIFPHETVRGFLEKTRNDKLVSGFILGKQNQRGVHTVTGGLEEKEIAQKYQDDASAIRVSYPHTAAILEKLSECYKEESLYEQKRELLDFRG